MNADYRYYLTSVLRIWGQFTPLTMKRAMEKEYESWKQRIDRW
jgi:hypothetical protein